MCARGDEHFCVLGVARSPGPSRHHQPNHCQCRATWAPSTLLRAKSLLQWGNMFRPRSMEMRRWNLPPVVPSRRNVQRRTLDTPHAWNLDKHGQTDGCAPGTPARRPSPESKPGAPRAAGSATAAARRGLPPPAPQPLPVSRPAARASADPRNGRHRRHGPLCRPKKNAQQKRKTSACSATLLIASSSADRAATTHRRPKETPPPLLPAAPAGVARARRAALRSPSSARTNIEYQSRATRR